MTESIYARQPSKPSPIDVWSDALQLATERCAQPHAPIEDWEADAGLMALFESLPAHAALSLPDGDLRKKVRVREAKDVRMKAILRELSADSGPVTILNHCCVFTRHARDLARELPNASIIAADIDPTWHRLYSLFEKLRLRRRPPNFRFVEESVYE